ncbi:MAG: YkgJ family cysteine cluster protein [Alphaproteobacteria bacterium]
MGRTERLIDESLSCLDGVGGKFSFCCECYNKNCCIDAYTLTVFSDEIEQIVDFSHISSREFVTDVGGDGVGRIRPTRSGGCFFRRSGGCGIHPVRPMDCRLFPFGLIDEAGRLLLTVYENGCPFPFDMAPFRQGVDKLLRRSRSELECYARLSTREIAGLKWTPVAELVFDAERCTGVSFYVEDLRFQGINSRR